VRDVQRWPRRSEARKERALRREIEIRVGHDDQWVLSAELEARRLEMAGRELADAPADYRWSP